MSTDGRIDAVARAVPLWTRILIPDAGDGYPSVRSLTDTEVARAILSTTDPGARAALLAEWADTDPQALLDALTRAGVLDEEDDVHRDEHGEPCDCPKRHEPTPRRLVTVWREVSP